MEMTGRDGSTGRFLYLNEFDRWDILGRGWEDGVWLMSGELDNGVVVLAVMLLGVHTTGRGGCISVRVR
jgi:hypothetical protein